MSGRERADKTRVAVVGATGYGGAELLRHLLEHPGVELVRLVAKDHIGQRIDEVHLSLEGLTDLVVEDLPPDEVAPDADLVFLGLPHRVSALVASQYARHDLRIIDLSGDYRLLDAAQYARYYGLEHPLPDLLGSYVYGLPEMNREAIASARHVSSPGCFATAITLALLPFARAGVLTGRVRVTAMTGSSGSGANPSSGTHHPLRAKTLRPYRPLTHQHTPEIEQSLRLSGATDLVLDFVPISAPLSRGILATCYFDVDASVTPTALHEMVERSYHDERLVRVLRKRLPQVGPIAGSMHCDVGISPEERIVAGQRTVVAHSAVDNLVKGGAGQAIQSMNLMLGLDEYTGLLQPSLWP